MILTYNFTVSVKIRGSHGWASGLVLRLGLEDVVS